MPCSVVLLLLRGNCDLHLQGRNTDRHLFLRQPSLIWLVAARISAKDSALLLHDTVLPRILCCYRRFEETFILNYTMSLKTGIPNYVAVNASKFAGFKFSLYYISVYLKHPDRPWNLPPRLLLSGYRRCSFGGKPAEA